VKWATATEAAEVDARSGPNSRHDASSAHGVGSVFGIGGQTAIHASGRWPANVMHDGSAEVVAGFPDSHSSGGTAGGANGSVYANGKGIPHPSFFNYTDSGSAARFFYCAKASRTDREEGCDNLPDHLSAAVELHGEGTKALSSPRAGAGRTADTVRNFHPTVKPTDLMRYLCRLVTPPAGLVLDPFCGSGSTGKAALLEGLRFVGVDLDPAHVAIAEARCQFAVDTVEELAAAAEAPGAQLTLF
jgi:site-specific DNA-methyltransferase (adenine-specific)